MSHPMIRMRVCALCLILACNVHCIIFPYVRVLCCAVRAGSREELNMHGGSGGSQSIGAAATHGRAGQEQRLADPWRLAFQKVRKRRKHAFF
eukprot:COSAG06_NODE_4799_length_3945_cov_8.420376_3_plen_92_part_00